MRPPGFHGREERPTDSATVKPTPDPTVLTTDAIALASRADRDWVKGQLDVLRERLNGIDRATEVLAETISRWPTVLDREVAHLRERTDLKFRTVETQLTERDERGAMRAENAKAAIEAALAAQKEAVAAQEMSNARAIAKAETATVDSIAKLAELLKITTDALAKDTRGLTERVGRMENLKQGGKDQISAVYAFAGFLVTLLILGTVLAANGIFDK